MASRALKIDPKKAATGQPQPSQQAPAVNLEEQIAIRAYQLWEERGRPIGSPEVDWRNAEEELRGTAGSATAA
ncbi:MAG TPA: DUF2934 domain-containing protein [Bryobacteraceae bacterium]|jgi:hypothetical protein|nr:DUF2934 domain-containing protein [Bryobacteraceae bacterium]